jgi:hypothetical protein
MVQVKQYHVQNNKVFNANNESLKSNYSKLKHDILDTLLN